METSEEKYIYLLLNGIATNYHNYGFSLAENVFGVYTDVINAAYVLKERAIQKCITECPNRQSGMSVNIPFKILATPEGQFVYDLAEIYGLKTPDITVKSQYSFEDFMLETETQVQPDPRLQEPIDYLNGLLQKKNEAETEVDKDSEIYKRFLADKRAYVLMKGDGLRPPHPVFRDWTLEQLNNLTFKEYKNNLEGPRASEQYGGLFFL